MVAVATPCCPGGADGGAVSPQPCDGGGNERGVCDRKAPPHSRPSPALPPPHVWLHGRDASGTPFGRGRPLASPTPPTVDAAAVAVGRRRVTAVTVGGVGGAPAGGAGRPSVRKTPRRRRRRRAVFGVTKTGTRQPPFSAPPPPPPPFAQSGTAAVAVGTAPSSPPPSRTACRR